MTGPPEAGPAGVRGAASSARTGQDAAGGRGTGSGLRRSGPRARGERGARPGVLGWSMIAAALLMAGSWAFMIVDGADVIGLFSGRTWANITDFGRRLLGIGVDRTPAFLDGGSWRHAMVLAGETLAMSVLAAGIAGAGALATVAFAARNITHGDMAPAGAIAGRAMFGFTRAVYIMTRAVPELIWAMLIIFVLSPGVLAGALALGLHNFGVLGRLGAEVVEDVDMRPVRALRSSGAGNLQVLAYGVLPQVLPQLVTFLLYRWEVIIRTTAVVGFVAAAGLGYKFRLDISFFRYTDVALLLLVYVLMVWSVDLASGYLRRLGR